MFRPTTPNVPHEFRDFVIFPMILRTISTETPQLANDVGLDLIYGIHGLKNTCVGSNSPRGEWSIPKHRLKIISVSCTLTQSPESESETMAERKGKNN